MQEKRSSVGLPASQAGQCDRGGEGEKDLGSAANRGCRDELMLQHRTEEEGLRKPGDDSLPGSKEEI